MSGQVNFGEIPVIATSWEIGDGVFRFHGKLLLGPMEIPFSIEWEDGRNVGNVSLLTRELQEAERAQRRRKRAKKKPAKRRKR